jgi:CRP-like cAMP-binding protein
MLASGAAMQIRDITLQDVFKDGKELRYVAGDIILRAGDTPSGFYFITEGWVKVYSLCDNGEPNIIMSLTVGDVFPMEWAFSETLHEVSFAAVADTRVRRVSRDHFITALTVNPGIVQAASRKLVRYLFQLSSELENLPYRSAREKVAFRLVSLATYFGQKSDSLIIIGPRVPNEYIARSTSMTRETASREMSWLARKGLIGHAGGHIIIKDMAGLEKEVGKDFHLSAPS